MACTIEIRKWMFRNESGRTHHRRSKEPNVVAAYVSAQVDRSTIAEVRTMLRLPPTS